MPKPSGNHLEILNDVLARLDKGDELWQVAMHYDKSTQWVSNYRALRSLVPELRALLMGTDVPSKEAIRPFEAMVIATFPGEHQVAAYEHLISFPVKDRLDAIRTYRKNSDVPKIRFATRETNGKNVAGKQTRRLPDPVVVNIHSFEGNLEALYVATERILCMDSKGYAKILKDLPRGKLEVLLRKASLAHSALGQVIDASKPRPNPLQSRPT